MIIWPDNLPKTPHNNCQLNQLNGLSSDEDILYQNRTRTYPEFEAKFKFQRVTMAQFQLVRNFYDYTLNQSKCFIANWLNLAGFNNHFCRFISPPSFTRDGTFFEMQIHVEIISSVPVDINGNIVYGS